MDADDAGTLTHDPQTPANGDFDAQGRVYPNAGSGHQIGALVMRMVYP